MRVNLAALASGLLFGTGLAVSGMVDPLRVLGFLDVVGDWDATLAFVMGGAVFVTAPAFWLARRRHAPVFAPKFDLPTATRIDRKLLLGAALFGIGWGIAGYCPGPALAGIAAMWRELVWFIPAYAVGAALVRP